MAASPRAQRLSQIRPGDRVTGCHYQALAVQAVTPVPPSSQPFDGVNVDRHEAAGRPGGEITRVRRRQVTITAVDPATNSISLLGLNNVPRTVVTENPEVQAFIRQLRVGGEVDPVYDEAVADSVEPMQ
ncbi:hypothetical protein [Teichococcus oryzae]|uniref:Uncharacterized protein n=1 Tax=Teichococcus oryzae TaxID=1608942 RepID=A0A5B2TED2_9PROT|nr:hypothetical protein [Pseudoroseomonas oryzae]KAA2212831.1 hypothetical protein F0Q34_11900 [Pseudoroseomonas oryzae]